MKHQFIADSDFGRLVNKELTHRLIKLHANGYDLDFCMTCNDYLTCVQNQERFTCESIIINVVDQVYDFISNSYKYVHTVDTSCGCKGIMVMEGIYGLYIRPDVMRHSFNQPTHNRPSLPPKGQRLQHEAILV